MAEPVLVELKLTLVGSPLMSDSLTESDWAAKERHNRGALKNVLAVKIPDS